MSILATCRKGENTALAESLRKAGVQVNLIGPAVSPLAWHPHLRDAVFTAVAQADIVHIHALWEEIQHQGAQCCRRLPRPCVLTPHGMLDPWSLRQKAFKKRLYLTWRLRRDLNGAAVLHFTAETERRLVAPLQLHVPTLVETLGLDLAEFQTLPEPGSFRRRYPQVGTRRIVLFLGRLHPKKGLELLIPAFAQAATADAVLVIAGPDADGYQAHLEKLVRAHGLTGRVVFTGMLYGADRIVALADAYLFVLPSYQENFGLAVVEALAAGTPVLISDQVNIHDQITAAGLGAVVHTRADELAAELARWLGDHELRRAAAAKARPFAWEHNDWNHIALRWGREYARLIAARPGGGRTPLAGVGGDGGQAPN